MYRHGDIYLIPCTSIPEGAKPVPRENGRVVLAHGEVTGHHHSLLEKDAVLFEAGDTRILQVESEAELTHQEHATITLPKGLFRVIRQREERAGMVRRVID